MSLTRLFRNLSGLLRQLWRKGFGYWARLALTVVVVNSLVGWLDSKNVLTQYRWQFYTALQRVSPGRLSDKNTVVVTIDDDEYWNGRLDRRVPIKRNYLADIVCKLDTANAAVIALDFDLRSPVPDGNPREAPDYGGETTKLLETVKDVSQRRSVVLPETLSEDENGYRRDSDIYNGFDFGKGDVSDGYIILPYDALRVPTTQPVQDTPVDSFSIAIARAFRPKVVAALPVGGDLPYGSFLSPEQFEHLPATDVLSGDPALASKVHAIVHDRVVIVGADWSRQAFGRGGTIDSHETPIGSMPGVYIHANYVEAILNDKTYKPIAEIAAKVVEWFLVVALAVSFATAEGLGSRLAFVGGSWILLALVN